MGKDSSRSGHASNSSEQMGRDQIQTNEASGKAPVTSVGLATTEAGTSESAMWREDLSALLTPQSSQEVTRMNRRKRNREAARRSRQRQKDQVHNLIDDERRLLDRREHLIQELEEWRMVNSGALKSPKQIINIDDVFSDSEIEIAEIINNLYSITIATSNIIVQMQLHLDYIIESLDIILGNSNS
ncbi:hypothetical protein IWW36_003204 [Coemansia brasiliensis]|uniref:BZIP domain-containing protein n=1 Tax=Coemansia brasiliensis TaxID=2650707 RepID=A0A9W8IAK6_9FUNG|nr:hypothetical protein IWW36_003204 [Coemansia brasiliensis]